MPAAALGSREGCAWARLVRKQSLQLFAVKAGIFSAMANSRVLVAPLGWISSDKRAAAMPRNRRSAKKSQSVPTLISAEEWKILVFRGVRYAASLLRRKYPNGIAPGGYTAEDFTNDSACALREDVEEDSDLAALLQREAGTGGIDPLVERFLAHIKKKIRAHSAKSRRRSKLLQTWSPDVIRPAALSPPNIDIEHAEERRRILDALAGRRALANKIAELVIDRGFSRRDELASQLGIDQEAVYEEMRWLRRNIEAILDQLDEEEVP